MAVDVSCSCDALDEPSGLSRSPAPPAPETTDDRAPVGTPEEEAAWKGEGKGRRNFNHSLVDSHGADNGLNIIIWLRSAFLCLIARPSDRRDMHISLQDYVKPKKFALVQTQKVHPKVIKSSPMFALS